MPHIPDVKFRNGNSIPQVGYGVFRIPPEETREAVLQAFGAGYRHIDTAALYDNEEGVGAALAESGLARSDVYVTTKLADSFMGRANALEQIDVSLEKLGLEQVDLFLIHWPMPGQDLFVETWEALLEIRESGKARDVGVSNFQVHHLERLRKETSELPVINQIEVHPWLVQEQLRSYHEEHGIVTEAWSPLAKGGAHLDNEVVKRIADAHGKSPAQVLLRWHVQLGNVVIPKTVTPSRMRENLALFDFSLSSGEMDSLTALDEGLRTGPDPDVRGA